MHYCIDVPKRVIDKTQCLLDHSGESESIKRKLERPNLTPEKEKELRERLPIVQRKIRQLCDELQA